MPELVENQSGGKGRVCGGCKAPTNSLGAPPLFDRKRLLNSPGHSALPPNLSQSFYREVSPLTRRSCSLPELIFSVLGWACFTSGLFELRTLPTVRELERDAAQCASARPKGSRAPEEGADRARCLGRSGARGARSTYSARSGTGGDCMGTPQTAPFELYRLF
ncbi:zinc finger protein 518A isoform X2 [Moschus berezovskii]|uniref:zinc finger protein 518A isoform X2 n=1 Tax=Moschus berezovskii TaxID=68408 RepID=UPI0024451F3C|nr:zinc finger protein 518A isoform X2 [Moschus berezovskii]XP_055280983.1 zinc finger protein 518A isoform X2 [Moschus berezovskii]